MGRKSWRSPDRTNVVFLLLLFFTFSSCTKTVLTIKLVAGQIAFVTKEKKNTCLLADSRLFEHVTTFGFCSFITLIVIIGRYNWQTVTRKPMASALSDSFVCCALLALTLFMVVHNPGITGVS